MSIAGPSSTFNGDFQMLAGYAADFTDPNPVGAPSGKLILDVPNRAFAPDIGQTFPIYYDAPPIGAVRLRLFNLRGVQRKFLRGGLQQHRRGPGTVRNGRFVDGNIALQQPVHSLANARIQTVLVFRLLRIYYRFRSCLCKVDEG